MATSSEIASRLQDERTERRHALVGCYVLAVAGALEVEGTVSATAGAAACAVLVLLLLNQHLAATSREEDEPVESVADGLFLALGLVPMAGLLAVVMPASQLTPAAWPLLVVAPLLMAVALSARALDLPPPTLGLRVGRIFPQALVALAGVPLGLLAYGVLTPPALAGGTDIVLAVVSLSALAFAEELLFRGMLQPRLWRTYGGFAILLTSLLSAAAALGVHSLGFGVLSGLVAAGFGHVTQRTGSIIGTTAARALMFIGLLIVWPHLLG